MSDVRLLHERDVGAEAVLARVFLRRLAELEAGDLAGLAPTLLARRFDSIKQTVRRGSTDNSVASR